MALPSGQNEYQGGIYRVYGFVALGFPRDRPLSQPATHRHQPTTKD